MNGALKWADHLYVWWRGYSGSSVTYQDFWNIHPPLPQIFWKVGLRCKSVFYGSFTIYTPIARNTINLTSQFYLISGQTNSPPHLQENNTIRLRLPFYRHTAQLPMTNSTEELDLVKFTNFSIVPSHKTSAQKKGSSPTYWKDLRPRPMNPPG